MYLLLAMFHERPFKTWSNWVKRCCFGLYKWMSLCFTPWNLLARCEHAMHRGFNICPDPLWLSCKILQQDGVSVSITNRPVQSQYSYFSNSIISSNTMQIAVIQALNSTQWIPPEEVLEFLHCWMFQKYFDSENPTPSKEHSNHLWNCTSEGNINSWV